MLILTLDSSRQKQSYSLYETESKIFLLTKILEAKSSSLLANLISDFEKQEIDIQTIDLIGINIGPGSFTGIRTGISIAKTLSLELQIKLCPINNFELVRFESKSSSPLALRAGLNDYFISLDEDYDNLETNFYNSNLQGLEIYEFQNPNISQIMTELILSKGCVQKTLSPYYLREPSLGK